VHNTTLAASELYATERINRPFVRLRGADLINNVNIPAQAGKAF
jgi:hypothetical protein